MMRAMVVGLLLAGTMALAAEPPGDWAYPVTARGKPAIGVKVGLIPFTYPTGGEPEAGQTRFTTTDEKGIARYPKLRESAPNMTFARLLARGKDGRGGYGMIFGADVLSPPVIDLLDNTELACRVIDPDGKPIPGVKLKPVALGSDGVAAWSGRPSVHADTPDWFWEEFPRKVSPDGTFTFAGVPIGHSLAVRFEAPDFGTGRFWLQPGKSNTVTLRKAGAVRVGFTVPKDGKPGDVRITLTRSASPDLIEATANATAEGAADVTLAGLPPGEYAIGFPYSGPGPLFPKAIAAVSVKPGETARVTTALEPAARITARLIDSRTGKGVPGAKLSAVVGLGLGQVVAPGQVAIVPEQKADSDGKLELLVPAGMVQVSPVAGDGYAVVRFTSDPFNQYQSAPVPVAPGKAHDFGTFALVKTVDVAGLVVDEAGRPVAGATVQVGYTGTNSWDGKPIVTDGTGRFTIRGLNPQGGVVGLTARKADAITAAPVAIDPAKLEGEIRIVVSEKFAARVRVRAVDRTGKPVSAAGIEIAHSVTYLARSGAAIGSGTAQRAGTTGTDGRFESAVLQPGDRYSVTLAAPGFRTVPTAEWEARPGESHDYGDVILTRSDLIVTGTVTDLSGKPVVGATVFTNADGPRPTTTTTDAAGRFSLPGLYEGLAFVSVRAEGFGFRSVPTEVGGAAVAITLRKLTDPPAPPPVISDAHKAATARLARHLLDSLWANRVAAGDEGKSTIRAMAKFDPATARKWCDEEKVRSGGKIDLTSEIVAADRDRNLLKTAKDDPDESIALLKPVGDVPGFRAVCSLARQLLPGSPAQALRIAEEAVVRARGLEEGERATALAQAGELVFRAGKKDAGRKLIEEAVRLSPSGQDDLDGYRRGMVAARVALYDPAACRKMIDPVKGASEFNRYLLHACPRAAEHNMETAKAWFADFRPDNSFSKHIARQWVAYRIVTSNVNEAITIARGIEDRTIRAATLVGLAERIEDRSRAFKLVDEAIDRIVADPTGYYNGGGGGTAAMLLFQARQLGHPDVACLRDKSLAARTAAHPGAFSQTDREGQTFALALATIDPDTARLILARALPPTQRGKLDALQTREALLALVLTDPAGATPVVDRILARAIAARKGYDNTGIDVLIHVLAEPDRAPAPALRAIHLFLGDFEED